MAAPIITEFNTFPGPGSTTLVEVIGSGFGVSQDSSFLRVGDTVAVITFWSETIVRGYVPNTVINQLARSHTQLNDIGIYTHIEIDEHIDSETAHGLESKVDKVVGGTGDNFVSLTATGGIQDAGVNADSFALKGHSHPGINFEFVEGEFIIDSGNVATEFDLPFTPFSKSEYIFHNGIKLSKGGTRDFVLNVNKVAFTPAYVSEIGIVPGDTIEFKFLKG